MVVAAIRPSGSQARDPFEQGIIELLPTLKAFAHSLCKSSAQAEDLVQDTYIRALLNRDKFEMGTNLRAWLFTILKNKYFSLLRKRKWEVEDVDGKFSARSSTPAEQETSGDFPAEFAQVVPMLALLAEDHRDVLVAVSYAGMSYEEAAVVFGVACGTIKSRVNRAHKALIQMLEEGQATQFDLSSWETATKGIPKSHPRYPIALAYEEIYAYLKRTVPDRFLPATITGQPKRELENYWDDLVSSGALDSSFDDLEGF